MRIFILYVFFVLGSFAVPGNKVFAQKDSLKVKLLKTKFTYGEYIDFEASLPNFKPDEKAITLQVWIEELKTGKRWKYRYPFINGFVAGSFKVFSSIPNGLYAFNFILQNDFFNIIGKQKVISEGVNELNYGIYLKNRKNFVETVGLNEQWGFQVKYLLFQDTAQFIFSPAQKKPAENNLLLQIETSLDSSFVPLQSVTKMITIGQETVADTIIRKSANSYRFSVSENDFRIKMPTVFIKAKKTTPIQQFDHDNSRGIFSGNDAIYLDGISTDAIARSANIIDYIMNNVPGMTYELNEAGQSILSWRGNPTSVFINELEVDNINNLEVNPIDIAMIKIFRPSTFANSFGKGGGIIAIYTKTGDLATRKYSFKIFGYNEFDVDWK